MSYMLGAEETWYRDLPGIVERLSELEIPDDEDLWNWGYCRRSAHGYEAHIESGFSPLADYLDAAGIEVDSILLCRPFQNGAAAFGQAVSRQVLPRLRAASRVAQLRTVGSGECVNVFEAIAEGRELINRGHDNVLILAAEQVTDETRRFRRYALFSDFCFALVITGDVGLCSSVILDLAIQGDSEPAPNTSRILARGLEEECVAALLAQNGVTLPDVEKCFYLNLFQPIAEMKGTQAGLRRWQLYSEAIWRMGHCYGADPFINMHSYLADGGQGNLHLLCASAREHAGVALVRRIFDRC